jgi:putative alpha-1,2-mannosidase
MKKLIELCGGSKAFESRLDTFFTNGYYNVWNEPGFLTPCLYNYIHMQAKTSAIVDKTRREYYSTAINGIPGNDDSGTMAAWFVFHALGFFPVSGQDIYLISSPMFEETTIHLEDRKTFTIRAKNVSDKNIYIQKATLNGQPLNRAWLRHKEIVDGGLLGFEMGDTPAAWDTGELPPSVE